MGKARTAWLFAVLLALSGCTEPTDGEPVSIAGGWKATVHGLVTGSVPMSMTLAHDQGTGAVTGSGRWVDTNLRIDGALAGTTVTLLIAAPPGGILGTMKYSGSVNNGAEKMAGTLWGPRWSPPLRVEFSRP